MKKVITVIGARPQFVKSGPLSKALRKHFQEIIVHSGQHYDANLSENILRDIGSPKPDYFLKTIGSTHGAQTASILRATEEVFIKESPDAVIVFGDTNTTLAASIAAVKLGIKLVHVEAGLRSFNKAMPEEINRIATDRISDFLFAPTPIAMKHLTDEGLKDKSYLTGDIMVDSVKSVSGQITKDILNAWQLEENKYYLLTMHRPYNVDNKENLLRILADLATLPYPIVFPIHPRTKKVLAGTDISPNIKLIEPQGYVNFTGLLKYSHKMITDSGGVQKEAYIQKKPCITLRTETEWVGTIDAGWNLLLPPENGDLSEAITAFNPSGSHPDLFGVDVADKMVQILLDSL
ncbi:MAG: UDP-N-acetylglucosamine 2-epimerase (non-hydrolyzing) [Candidatus Zophobacter franzmannii]|nr:UDP-N-acetylglucosamine 2-epimerase (non-hydrolyzing) [Candidatus Zophobacter franzmannii]